MIPPPRGDQRAGLRAAPLSAMIPPMTDTPDTPDTPPPADAAPAPSGSGAPTIIRIPILISGILNCLVALAWVPWCVTIVLSIPLIILAVFEFIYFSKLGQVDFAAHKSKVKLISILEICTIIAGNVGSLVCGIIVLVNIKEIPDPPSGAA